MKIYYLFLAVAVLLISTAATAQQAESESGPVALTIVLDSAWSNEHEMSDYISLSRQGIASLKPGDYIEIIVAASGKPKIRAAQFIKSGNAQEVKAITSQLGRINCPFLSDGSLYKTVDLALRRLTKTDKNTNFSHATVIIFTDGKVNDKDVRYLQQLSKEFKKKNWSLCITGTHHTNKKLLVAAHQGNFKFSLISDANPVLWIKTQQESTSTSASDSRHAKDVANPGSMVNIETRVSITENPGKNGAMPQTVAEDIEPKAKEPNRPVITVAKPIPAKPKSVRIKPPVKPKTKPVKKPFKLSKNLLWLIPIAIAAVVAVLFILGLYLAYKPTSDPDRERKFPRKTPGTLVAKINGQTYTLGRKDRIGTINIGSGPNNTIRIPDKSISDRHIRIYRKGSDLFLQNIGKTAVIINSASAKPNSKERLTIPSTIEFDGKNRITLTLLKPKPVHQTTDKENKNGTASTTTR